MKLGKEDFKQILKHEAGGANIILDDMQLEDYYTYISLLLEWNEKINLTAITEDHDVIKKHIVDCLQLIKYIPEQSKIVDIGTGAGLPGVILAIYFGERVNITLLDALSKRMVFLEKVKEELNLSNIRIVSGRAEELSRQKEYREKFDIAVSRAVARLNILCEYSIAFIKPNGKLLFMKGSSIDEEISESKNAFVKLGLGVSGVNTYNLMTEESLSRSIVELTKTKPTTEEFPRHNSKIKKLPL